MKLFGSSACGWMALVGASLVLAPACGDSTAEVGTGGSGANTTGPGGSATSASGGSSTGTGTGTGNGGTSAGLPPPTEEAPCGNQVYDCGDLVDNDNDGLVDYQDPDCLGPCDNTEDSYYPNLPGASGQDCDLDCFWDTGLGHNWECYWDHQCDPLADVSNGTVNPQPDCSWDSATDGPVGGQSFSPSPLTCDESFSNQPQDCLDECKPLAPNGCDCFGCCELDDQYVWVGSVVEGTNTGTCTLESVGTPSFTEDCHPCTPVPGCNNPCDTCELCIGKTTLPPECFGDGGGGAGGNPPQDCPDNQQACGLPGQDPCPGSSYCITGCCVPLPQ
jgi:hypothetical protein